MYHHEQKFTVHKIGNYGLFLCRTAAGGIMCGIFAIHLACIPQFVGGYQKRNNLKMPFSWSINFCSWLYIHFTQYKLCKLFGNGVS